MAKSKKKSKPKYFGDQEIKTMIQARDQIFAIREKIFQEFKVDLLDTDALSSLSVYEIVTNYDPNYNVNFARNGEDAKSGGILIENKTTKVDGPLTAKKGIPRKGAGTDAAFQFHAMGDIEHPRYIFVARLKKDLSVVRIYDISNKNNIEIIRAHLYKERKKWEAKNKELGQVQKRDTILIKETIFLEKLNFVSELLINNCRILRD